MWCGVGVGDKVFQFSFASSHDIQNDECEHIVRDDELSAALCDGLEGEIRISLKPWAVLDGDWRAKKQLIPSLQAIFDVEFVATAAAAKKTRKHEINMFAAIQTMTRIYNENKHRLMAEIY